MEILTRNELVALANRTEETIENLNEKKREELKESFISKHGDRIRTMLRNKVEAFDFTDISEVVFNIPSGVEDMYITLIINATSNNTSNIKTSIECALANLASSWIIKHYECFYFDEDKFMRDVTLSDFDKINIELIVNVYIKNYSLKKRVDS